MIRHQQNQHSKSVSGITGISSSSTSQTVHTSSFGPSIVPFNENNVIVPTATNLNLKLLRNPLITAVNEEQRNNHGNPTRRQTAGSQ